MLYNDLRSAYLQAIESEIGLRPRTVSVYADRLNAWDKWLASQNVEGDSVASRYNSALIRRYLFSLSQLRLRPRTVRNRLAPLRSMGVWAVEKGILKESPAADVKLPKKDAARRDIVSDDELSAMFEAVERQRDGHRAALERAMLYVLALTGTRFSELLDMRIRDVNMGNRTLVIADGKGGKSRLLYPPEDALAAISAWLTERSKMKCQHDWLWAYSISRRMGEVGTRAMLEDIKARAGLANMDHIKPHSLRRVTLLTGFLLRSACAWSCASCVRSFSAASVCHFADLLMNLGVPIPVRWPQ